MFEASLIALALAMAIAYFFSVRFHAPYSPPSIVCGGIWWPPARHKNLAPDADDELGEFRPCAKIVWRRSLRGSLDRLSLESVAPRGYSLRQWWKACLAVDHEMRITFLQRFFSHASSALPRDYCGNAPRCSKWCATQDFATCFRQVLASGKPLKQRLEVPGGRMGVRSRYRPRPCRSRHPSRPAGAPLRCCTISRIWNGWNASVRISSPMFSHELRTPLTAIRGYAETLLEGALEGSCETTGSFLEIIKAQAARLNNIASDLLVLSELESGEARHG